MSSRGLLGFWRRLHAVCLVAADPGFEAAVEDADEPAWAGAMMVFRWGPRFPAAGVMVFRWGHPATRRTYDDPYIRPACWAW